MIPIAYPDITGTAGPAPMQSPHSAGPFALFDLRRKSLLRGNILVLASFFASVVLSDFPHNRATLLLLVPAIFAVVGTFDTLRCMRRRWDFYHAGVILCIYMDLMAVCLILFLLVYPYTHSPL